MPRTTTAALAGLMTLGFASACSQTTSDTAPADAAGQTSSSTTSADMTAPADMTGSAATTTDQTTGQTQTAPQQSAPAASSPTPATQADITAGATVNDINGVMIGTIGTVDSAGAVLNAGGQQVKVPINAFGKTATGLVIGTTKADFDAQVAASQAAQPSATPGGTPAPTTPPPSGSGTSTPPQ